MYAAIDGSPLASSSKIRAASDAAQFTATHVFTNVDTAHPQGRRLTEDVHREMLGLIPLHCVGRQMLGREVAGSVTNRPLVIGQSKHGKCSDQFIVGMTKWLVSSFLPEGQRCVTVLVLV